MTITKSTGRGPSSDALRISIDQRGAILHGTPRRTPSKAGQGRSLSSPLCFGGSCVFLPKRSKPKSQVRRNRDGAKKRLLLSDRPPGLTRPGTSKRVVVMTEAHMTYLVIFSGKFIQIHPGLAPKTVGSSFESSSVMPLAEETLEPRSRHWSIEIVLWKQGLLFLEPFKIRQIRYNVRFGELLLCNSTSDYLETAWVSSWGSGLSIWIEIVLWKQGLLFLEPFKIKDRSGRMSVLESFYYVIQHQIVLKLLECYPGVVDCQFELKLFCGSREFYF